MKYAESSANKILRILNWESQVGTALLKNGVKGDSKFVKKKGLVCCVVLHVYIEDRVQFESNIRWEHEKSIVLRI